MILILSEDKDITTDIVIEWFLSFQIKFVRVNDFNFYNIIQSVNLNKIDSNIIFKIDTNTFDIQDISSIWFRRGRFYFQIKNDLKKAKDEKDTFTKHLDAEVETLSQYIYFKLKQKPSINNPLCYNMNKLLALEYALKVGLDIPNTIITKEKKELICFKKEQSIITKNIQDVLLFESRKYSGTTTLELKNENIDEMNDEFFYSLFQYKIEKKYELRIFYLNGLFYTAAIFNHNKNIVDIRTAHPNNNKALARIVPYNLPPEIKEKLHQFMLLAKLESGSIDMIVNKEGEYVFLEVNPVGQLDYVSKMCNYNIEKEIALQLMKYN